MSQKTLFLGQKVWKKFGKVRKQGFPNIRKFRNRTNSKFSVNSECLETPAFDPKTGVSKLFDPKTGFFDPKTGLFDPKTGFFDPKTGNYF